MIAISSGIITCLVKLTRIAFITGRSWFNRRLNRERSSIFLPGNNIGNNLKKNRCDL